jgi:outer membrane immunogenic protein
MHFTAVRSTGHWGVQITKKLALAFTAMAMVAGPAAAADMAARPVKALPPPAPVVSWTGCYLSVGGGYGIFKMDHNERANIAGVGPANTLIAGEQTSGGDGWLFTGGGGCDYQFNPRWVVGAFADGTWSELKGTHGTTPLVGFDDLALQGQMKQDWSWAVGARIGYLVNPSFLTYVNAGYTQAHLTAVNLNFIPFDGGLFTGAQLPGQTLDGYFIGAGMEYSFDWLPGLFVRSEGRGNVYTRKDVLPTCVANTGFCALPAVPGVLAGNSNVEDRRLITYTSKVELVYRFNWTGPVVAKY